jgi:hypothetical protein
MPRIWGLGCCLFADSRGVISRCLTTLAVGVLATGLALAQTRDTGAIFGSVADSQAAVIPGATVHLTSVGTGQVRTTLTNDSGDYLFSLLPVGTYSVSVEHAGFRRYERKGVLLQANENIKVDAALQVGDVQSSITVDAQGSQVETRLTTVKETVDTRRVVDLPLNGRNAADLSLLSTGVTSGIGNNSGDSNFADPYRPRGQKQLTVNGSRNNNLRYTLDGGEHMDDLRNFNLPFPFPDALQEFSVQTSNMGVEHGVSSAGAVNVVTKSGTNQIHGDAFWFIRNTALNASNFFSRAQDNLKRNQAGFTLGGPILKNKLFVFGGFQDLDIRTAPGNSQSQSLTAAERIGDFSGNPIIIYDPKNGLPFTDNKIPSDRLSPAAVSMLKLLPLPDPDGFTRYRISFGEKEKQYIVRGDYVINARQNLTLRYFHVDQQDPFTSPANNLFALKPSGLQPSTSATLAYTFLLTPTLLTHAQVTGTHLRSRSFTDSKYSYNDFGVKVYAPSNDITVGIANSGGGVTTPRRTFFQRASQEYTNDWTWTKGDHTFTWGALFSWRQYNNNTIYETSGAYTFDGHATGSGNQNGYDRADFMLGLFSSFIQNNGEFENRRQPLRSFYAGDTWRVKPHLTLNFGLRYEPYSFFSDKLGRNMTFDFGNYYKGIRSTKFINAPPGMLFPGDPAPKGGTIPKAATASDNNNLGPRIGFAWDPFGNGKTSIRGGYAIYYDVPSMQAFNDATDLTPWSYSVQFNDGLFDDPYRGRENLNLYPLKGFPPDTPFASPYSTIVQNPKFTSAYTQNWSFTVEREVFKDARLRVGYVGTKATHLKSEYDANAPIYNTSLTLAQNRATIDARRPLQGYQTISYWFHGLNSDYNALQVSFDKRYGHGFTWLTSYTWSKTLDYISVNGYTGGNRVSNPFNFFFARSVADQNRPQRLVNSFVWDLPPMAHQSAPVKAVLGAWRLSGITTFQAGRPFTVAASNNPTAGAGSARADLIGAGNPVLDTGRSKGEKIAKYFDTSRFANPAPDTFGTLGRNAMVGPGFVNVDASLAKNFPLRFLGEGGLLEFRFEAFNVANRTDLGLPNTGITNPLFGKITGTDGDPRILQFSLKVMF